MEEHDAVIVGARCAGAVLAIELAERGWDVLLVDRDRFPSDTVSTHFMFPNSLARLERLGVLDMLRADHELPLLLSRFVALGNEIVGAYTPIEGYDRGAAPRRCVLDKAMVNTALAAGAQGRFGERVVGLMGTGGREDAVKGVVLAGGQRIGARWVFGADGRGSVVARSLGLPKQRPARGEIALSYAYWRGIPNNGYSTQQIEPDRIVNRYAVEDGLHILVAGGTPELVRGTDAVRTRKYLDALGRFPETIKPALLAKAERVSRVQVAPEPLMRGFFRTATGPGWALVGDAGHYKHPATAQGIADAIEQALYVAGALSADGGHLRGYEAWRDARAAEHTHGRSAGDGFPDNRPPRRSSTGSPPSRTPPKTYAMPSVASSSPPGSRPGSAPRAGSSPAPRAPVGTTESNPHPAIDQD